MAVDALPRLTTPAGVQAGARIVRGLRQHGLLLALLVAAIVANLIAQPALFDVDQIGLIVQIALPAVLVGFAQTIAVVCGGLDLSVGAVMAMANVLAATWLSGSAHGADWHLGLILLIVLAAGAINGVLIAVFRFEAFIATLATWSVFNGVALTLLKTDGGLAPTWLTDLVTGDTAGVPTAYVMLVVILLVWLHLRRTRFGMQLYAVGSDAERARLSGIRVTRIKIMAFALSGLAAGVGGILLAGATSTGQPTVGNNYILPSFAAVVIGGSRLGGGSGGVGLTTMAVLLLVLISNFIGALDLDNWVSVVATSGLLLAVVALRALFDPSRKEVEA
jgi:ribose transport system permease protein